MKHAYRVIDYSKEIEYDCDIPYDVFLNVWDKRESRFIYIDGVIEKLDLRELADRVWSQWFTYIVNHKGETLFCIENLALQEKFGFLKGE